MKRLRWMAARWARLLGLPGLAGLALLAGSAFFCLAFSLPAAERLEKLSRNVAMARMEKAAAPAADAGGAQRGMDRFYAFFPRKEDAPQLLEKMAAAAREESILLKQGEYKYSPEKTGKLGQYQISLPVQGSYLAVRRFIDRVLNTVSSAALDNVSFRRETAGSTELDAKIRFTVFLDDH